jgi:outer membrane protein TolC
MSFQAVMDSVTTNNKSLSASRQYYEAQKVNVKTGIYLANPSVSFDKLSNPLGNYSEMVISQSFDFPTAYVQKGKIADLAASQTDERFRQAKIAILSDAVQVYAEIIYTNRKLAILEKRQQMASQLQTGIEKRLSTGDANIIEANRIRSEAAITASELLISENHKKNLLLKLSELNGGKPLVVNDTIFPALAGFTVSDTLCNAISARNPQLKLLESEVIISRRNVSLQRSLSMPKFEIGYRQDINTGKTFSGFHAGITIPLFENKNTVKAAKIKQLYANEAVVAGKLEIQNIINQLVSEYSAVSKSMNNLNDVFKTLNTPNLLFKAYNTGQISFTGFFNEYENYRQTAFYIEDLKQREYKVLLQLYILQVY